MLTAKDGEHDHADALDLGVDAYLTKPCSFVVLLATLRALVRRGASARPAVLHVGPLELDPAAHRVRLRGAELGLRPREYALLHYLMRRPGEAVSKADILANVWDEFYEGDPNIVEVYVSYLRRKLGAPGRPADHRDGPRRAGYRLRARQCLSAARGAGPPARAGGRGSPSGSGSRSSRRSPSRSGSRWRAALLVLSLRWRADRRAGRLGAVAGGGRRRALRRGDTAQAVRSTGGDSSLVQVSAPTGRSRPAASRCSVSGPSYGSRCRQRPAARRGEHREEDYRAYATAVTAGPAQGGAVVVVAPTADVEEAMVQLALRVLLGGPVLLALICAAVWVLVGYALHTVERLRGQVAELSVAGLDRRVDVPVAHDEVRQLALTMNGLLDRLQRSAHAQRRFVADAAHELRTPLAALRARLEVDGRADDLDRWRQAVRPCSQDAERLSALVDDLLALARLDESPRLRRPVPVDLDEIVFAEVARLRGTTAVDPGHPRVSAGLVHGDPDLLTRVVRNLLGNAVRHAGTSCGWRCRRWTGRSSSRSLTTGRASRQPSGSACSSGSTGSTRPGPATAAAAGWAWPSCATRCGRTEGR